MRWLLVFSFLFIIEYYSWQGFKYATLFGQQPTRLIGGVLLAILLILTYGYIVSFTSGWVTKWPKSLDTLIRAVAFITLFAKFIVGGFILLDDVRRVLGWAAQLLGLPGTYHSGRSSFLANTGIIVGAIPFIALLYGIIRNGYRYRVHRHVVNKSGLPAELNGLKIVQISDIHAGSFYRLAPLQEAVDLINAEKPDLVFFTGDLVNNVAKEMEPYQGIFAGIRAKYGVYSVLGNHDYGDYVNWNTLQDKKQNLLDLFKRHAAMGWQLLNNEHRIIPIQGQKIAVIGVENFSAHPRFPKYGNLSQAAAGCPEDVQVKILLSHDPSHWQYEVTTHYQDIDLTLSGHTHGFQFGVEIPGWLKWSPSQYIYNEWAGLYIKGAQYLNVNRGLGLLGYPGRVGILPEITSIVLRGA